MELIEPLGLLHGEAAESAIAAGLARPLAGGPAAFTLARLIGAGAIVPVAAVPARFQAALASVAAPRPGWAGFPPGRLLVMGILNVTPDSFSDGGRMDPAAAIAHGLEMAEAGADIVDVGGESTRPGAAEIEPAEEGRRVLPVIAALARQGVAVSIDTRHAATMAAALEAGARIVNDVSALAHDPAAAALAAARACPVVLMHMRGDPATMNALASYDDVAVEVTRELAARLAAARAAGVADVALDPGIGFAKRAEHNLALLRHIGLLHNLGCPLLVGVSRKAFIGRLTGASDPRDRVAGSLAAALPAALAGATVLRVHDVTETAQAVRVWRGLGLVG